MVKRLKDLKLLSVLNVAVVFFIFCVVYALAVRGYELYNTEQPVVEEKEIAVIYDKEKVSVNAYLTEEQREAIDNGDFDEL